MKFNQEYFRYILRKKKIRIVDVAELIQLSDRQVNKHIRDSSFKLHQVKKILDMLNMKFDEVFKFEK